MTITLSPPPPRIRAELVVLDDRFRKVAGDEYVECLYDGGRWLEGPAYSPAWRCLIFSDIPNDRLLRWDEVSGQVSVFRQPSGYINGNTLDREGRPERRGTVGVDCDPLPNLDGRQAMRGADEQQLHATWANSSPS